jgi:hypothetical protein
MTSRIISTFSNTYGQPTNANHWRTPRPLRPPVLPRFLRRRKHPLFGSLLPARLTDTVQERRGSVNFTSGMEQRTERRVREADYAQPLVGSGIGGIFAARSLLYPGVDVTV